MEYCTQQQQIPSFGHWEDYYDYEGLPITQYFESAWQAGLVGSRFWDEEDEDLFKVPVIPGPIKHDYKRSSGHHRKVVKTKKGGVNGLEKLQKHEKEKEKEGGGRKVVVVVAGEVINQRGPRRSTRVPKAVDEDLYKIPPELVSQRPKKKRLLSNLLSGCLGLNCIL